MSDDKGPVIVVTGLGGGADRRAADRITHEVEAELRVGDHVIMATTENVSASGAFLTVPSPMAVGTRLHLKFQLPGGAFEAWATIMRIRPTAPDRGPGIGVMFHEVPATSRVILDAFCPPVRPIVRHGPG
ncbi:MAG: PilZ domain-containing protein [Polyangiaceae bacterium]